MCGRYTLRTVTEEIAAAFSVAEMLVVEARYNIAPTQEVLGIRQTPEGREASFLKWGLIPAWAKDAGIGARLINARSETVAEKPAFREAFKRRRCLIPADGFYEWARTNGKKQPFYFRLREERPFGFAGLWEKWRSPAGEVVESCTILTTEANELLRPVHDRMPVILPPEDYQLWLNEDERQRELLKELLRPFPAKEMMAYPVSAQVNRPSSQGRALIEGLPLNSA